MAKFDLNDSSVVCIIGSGAGGGTLGNELAQKGIKVVCLEAGPRLKLDDIKNDFLGMFGKLSWLDSRDPQNYGGLIRTPNDGEPRKHIFYMHDVADQETPKKLVESLLISMRLALVGDPIMELSSVRTADISEEGVLKANVANEATQGAKQYSRSLEDSESTLFSEPTAVQDIKEFLSDFEKIKLEKISKVDWLKKAYSWKKNYPIVQKSFFKQKKFVNPYVFIDFLSKILKKDDIIIADDGAHLTWTMQAFKVKYGQKLFSAFGNSPMGYSLPASIGASIAKKNKKVICIDGDGSIQINIQELHTIKKLKLPIKIFILNNNGYGIIKQFQELYLGGRFEASGKGVSNPNFKKISSAYEINHNIIKNHKDLSKLKKIINSNKPEIIEILIKPNQKIIPKLQFGNPLEDMSPLLPRSEFFENMEVPLSIRDNKIFEAN